MKDSRKILIIAGPNGAGKTTFAKEFLPNEATFINADLIAAGLNPSRPDLVAVQAGRLMLEMIHDCVERKKTFAFETTLSGHVYSRMIPVWQKNGYLVKLLFLRLPIPEMAIERVRQRVIEGGHDVPEQTVRRRFYSGWDNFQLIYRDMVDDWVLYDSSGGKPVLIEQKDRL
ncbi:MAG: AAA family ATPase [Candidatus Dadabacteria bacterium]|nr:AAA family ATPase [Candidatus Dadabacteria bacterium]